MACRIMEPGSAYGDWGHSPSFFMHKAEESSDSKASSQFAMKNCIDSSSLSLHQFPRNLQDRRTFLHSRVVELREEDHQLAGYVLESMDHPKENHRGHTKFLTSNDNSLNCFAKPFIPSPLGMRSMSPVWEDR